MQKISIYGKHCAEHALRSPYVQIDHIRCTQEQSHLFSAVSKKLIEICKIGDLPSQYKHQGIEITLRLNLAANLSECEMQEWKTILFLDRLSDPMNVGSILRHAVAFGVDAVCLPKNHGCPITPAVAHASSGALFEIPVIYTSSLNQQLRYAKDAGFGLIGTSLKQGQSELFSQSVFWPKSAIVIGEEGAGLSHGVEQLCDHLVFLPMNNQRIQSLNAAVCASIICYERYKGLSAK